MSAACVRLLARHHRVAAANAAFTRAAPLGARHASTTTGADAPYDVCVVGGGIIGCATAMTLKQRMPHLRMVLVEKEAALAVHQSGRNSGVIHAGIYYVPGTLRARLCVKGMAMMYDYCDAHDIPYKKCGKLIIATNDVEVDRLRALFERAKQNGCADLRLIDGDEIATYEPLCVGRLALLSPHTGIVDFGRVTKSMGATFVAVGGELVTGFTVDRIRAAGDGMQIAASDGRSIRAAHVITCAGLHADRVSRLTGCAPSPRIVPFRGEYLRLKNPKMASMNIYPVPDPSMPFLGVHFTPRIDGEVWLGPNAVLAMAREGYSWGTINVRDLCDAVLFRGMQRLMLRNMVFGLTEMYRSFNMRAQVRQAQRFFPSITAADVERGPCGVRAQALADDGTLVEDFVFDGGDDGARVLHVRNAPSPAATSSLAIAELIADRATADFKLADSK